MVRGCRREGKVESMHSRNTNRSFEREVRDEGEGGEK